MKSVCFVMLLLIGCSPSQTDSSSSADIFLNRMSDFVKQRVFLTISESSVVDEKSGKKSTLFGNSFLVDKDLLITPHHVVYGPTDASGLPRLIKPKVYIIAKSGGFVEGVIVAEDKDLDMALIRARVTGKILELEDKQRFGHKTYVVGLKPIITLGLEIATSFIHEGLPLPLTNMPHGNKLLMLGEFTPGMSGSAVLNENGKVIGMLIRASASPPSGIAVTSDSIKQLIEKYKNGKK